MTFYSFDTSAIINGRRDMLPPATFPTLWGKIEAMIQAGSVRAVDEVERELVRKEDEAAKWAKAQSGLFVPLDPPLQRETAAILNDHPRLVGKDSGRNTADPFVIALARLSPNGVVVTEERNRTIENPRIPDVCEALGVRWLGLVDFVREQGWAF